MLGFVPPPRNINSSVHTEFSIHIQHIAITSVAFTCVLETGLVVFVWWNGTVTIAKNSLLIDEGSTLLIGVCLLSRKNVTWFFRCVLGLTMAFFDVLGISLT